MIMNLRGTGRHRASMDRPLKVVAKSPASALIIAAVRYRSSRARETLGEPCNRSLDTRALRRPSTHAVPFSFRSGSTFPPSGPLVTVPTYRGCRRPANSG
jgi:hypothetical protein